MEGTMIHPIVKFGAPVLETPTKPVEKFDEKLAELVADMFESMYAAQGVGLAATQIGLGVQGSPNGAKQCTAHAVRTLAIATHGCCASMPAPTRS